MRALFLVVLAFGCSQSKPSPECTTDQDCADPEKPTCSDRGVCVVCARDGQCAQGFLCVDGACAPGCLNETDRCEWPLRCHAGEGCVCEFDFSCPVVICLGQMCPLQHEGCSTDADCDGGICVTTTHAWASVCWACTPSSYGVDTCPAGRYCDPATGCEPGCKTNSDCAGLACTNHVCE